MVDERVSVTFTGHPLEKFTPEQIALVLSCAATAAEVSRKLGVRRSGFVVEFAFEVDGEKNLARIRLGFTLQSSPGSIYLDELDAKVKARVKEMGQA